MIKKKKKESDGRAHSFFLNSFNIKVMAPSRGILTGQMACKFNGSKRYTITIYVVK